MDQQVLLTSRLKFIITAIVCLVVTFMVFAHLGTLSIRKWDEVRNALNAVEMSQNGFSFVTTYDWKPDHWNTKPPLLIWIQALFVKIFGINEIAIRLPTALAALSFLGIFAWVRKQINASFYFWVIAVLLFFTTPYILYSHTFRSGDYDGILCLFLFLHALNYFFYLKKGKTSFLIANFLFLQLAVLTKGIVGFMLLPGILLFTLQQGMLLKLLKQTKFWLGALSIVLVTFSYYFIRDKMDPGYWLEVIDNELGGRYLDVTEGHSGHWYSYLRHIATRSLKYYIWFLPLAIFIVWKIKAVNKLMIFCAINFFSYLLIISLSATKISWYLLPIVPFFVLFMALTFEAINEKSRSHRSKLLLLGFSFLFLLFPLYDKVYYLLTIKNTPTEESLYYLPNFLRAHMDDDHLLEGLSLFVTKHVAQERFYVEAYEAKGGKIYFKDLKDMEVGDRVLIAHDPLEKLLKSRFQLHLEHEEAENKIYLLESEISK